MWKVINEGDNWLCCLIGRVHLLIVSILKRILLLHSVTDENNCAISDPCIFHYHMNFHLNAISCSTKIDLIFSAFMVNPHGPRTIPLIKFLQLHFIVVEDRNLGIVEDDLCRALCEYLTTQKASLRAFHSKNVFRISCLGSH